MANQFNLDLTDIEGRRKYGRLYRTLYYADHYEKIDAYSTAYRKKYPEKHRQYCLNTHKNNPRKYTKSYFRRMQRNRYHKNPEVYLMYRQFKNLEKYGTTWRPKNRKLSTLRTKSRAAR